MSTIVIDAETRSRQNLRQCGASRYAADPTTEILCVGYAIDNNTVTFCLPGQDDTEIKYALKHAETLVAHNALFERMLFKHILAPTYGWPQPCLESWVDTMALTYASALPGALEKVTTILNLNHRKQSTGTRTMLQVSKPRKAHKDEDPNAIYWYDDEERLQKLYDYCMADVAAERELYHTLEPLSEQETAVWCLDQQINDRGFCIDVKLAQAARDVAATAFQRLNKEMTKLTDGHVSSITEVAKLKAWLLMQGLGTVGAEMVLDKAAIGELLLTDDIPATAKRALELRQLGAQAAVKKVDAFLNHVDNDKRIRGAFQYHAAGPGRWASRGVQVQNIKRADEKLDIDRAIAIIGSGDYRRVAKEYKAPLATIGFIIRAMICAKPGHVLIGADFSGIEARITAWLADEYSKLDVFRKFDAGTGPDPYVVAATKIFQLPVEQIDKAKRNVGKAAELAFGFGGGLGAYLRLAPKPVPIPHATGGPRHTHGDRGGAATDAVIELVKNLSDAEIHNVKNAWRAAHPNIKQMWYGLYDALIKAIEHRNKAEITYDKIKFFCDDHFAWMTLPSGRRIAYPQPGFGHVLKFGETVIRVEDAHLYSINELVLDWDFAPQRVVTWKDNSKGWRDVKGWPGIITENAVQGIARDLLAEAMVRVNAAGLPIVAHIHDSIVIEVPEKGATKVVDKLIQLMCHCPQWATGLPIVAKPWLGKRFE